MTNDDEVLGFIHRFTLNGTRQQVIDCFTGGCCYWFAHVLLYRFMNRVPMPKLVYNPENNHFATLINGRVYDITGDVTDLANWAEFSRYYREASHSVHDTLLRDCIDFGTNREE